MHAQESNKETLYLRCTSCSLSPEDLPSSLSQEEAAWWKTYLTGENRHYWLHLHKEMFERITS